jgi:hypothetical protein
MDHLAGWIELHLQPWKCHEFRYNRQRIGKIDDRYRQYHGLSIGLFALLQRKRSVSHFHLQHQYHCSGPAHMVVF